MQLSVLLMLALSALFSAGSCQRNEPVQLGTSLKDRVPNNTNLEWQIFDGSLPNEAISIGNAGRTEYVCQSLSSTGFYSPGMDHTPSCHYSWGTVMHITPSFEILVNKDNFEIIEWKEGQNGSVPENSVGASVNEDIYVGRNHYGLGKVSVNNRYFYHSRNGHEKRYSTYQVLTINRDIDSEQISDVEYNSDGVIPITYPPETMQKSAITNKGCQTVTGTATLSKAFQVEKRWDTSFSITVGAKITITAGVPLIASTSIDFSIATSLQLTEGTTHTESTSHSVPVTYIIPPNHSCRVRMVGYKYGADIPYTARVTRTYKNGQTRRTSISGTYKGVSMGEVRGVADRCEPLPDPKPCPTERTTEEGKQMTPEEFREYFDHNYDEYDL